MPGIVGIINGSHFPTQRDAIGLMVERMLHEPFYRSGVYVNEKLGLAAGWVCHQGSFSDCMPAWNDTRDICLLFSGEHLADRSEIEHAPSGEHRSSGTDAAYLVRLYERDDERFYEGLNGAFSGLVIDLRQNKIVLFNDRYGLGRIYYYDDGHNFFFASEAKAILKLHPTLRELDLRSFGEFLTCGCVLQNRTIFRGVSLLPGASMWTFRPRQQIRKETYFRREVWEEQEPLSENEYYDKLKETFSQVLARYLRSGERIAMSLTGGLDSRMIMAWAPCKPSTLPCFSNGGMYRDSEDVKFARRVAAACGQPHSVLRVDRRFFSEFPSLAARSVYLTDGTMDVTGSAGLFVNRLAREMAPIRLTGNYGSEILRWILAFRPVSMLPSIFNDDFRPHLRDGAAAYEREVRGNRRSFIAFKQVPWHHYARFALEQSQLTIRSPYLDNELVALAYRAPRELVTNQKLAARLIADGNGALVKFPTDRGPLGRPGLLGRTREAYQEFTFKADYAFDYGMPQWLAQVDRILAPFHFETVFLGRHKYYHFRIWYRKELSGYVKEVLLDPRTLARPFLDRKGVENMVMNHIRGHRNHTLEIHKLMTAEFILRDLIEAR